MAVINNGLPKLKLKAVDIRDTLNANGGSVTNKTSSYFSINANINKWSKHKPIVTGYVDDTFLDYDDPKWDQQQGSAPSIVSDLATAWKGSKESDWYDYTPPKGGISEPMRMGDFRGYRADAFSPFQTFSVDNTVTTHLDSTNFMIYIRIKLNNEDDPAVGGMLSLTDLGIFDTTWNDIRVAVIDYFKGSYNLYLGQSFSDANWGYASVNIDWEDSVNNSGDHEFAAALYKTDGTFYPLPFERIKVKVETYHINDYYGTVTGDAHLSADGVSGYITVSVPVTCGGGNTEAKTFTNTFYVGSSPNQLIYQIGSDSITLEPNDTGTLSVTLRETDSGWNSNIISLLQGGEVWANYNSGESGAVRIM